MASKRHQESGAEKRKKKRQRDDAHASLAGSGQGVQQGCRCIVGNGWPRHHRSPLWSVRGVAPRSSGSCGRSKKREETQVAHNGKGLSDTSDRPDLHCRKLSMQFPAFLNRFGSILK
ncbi:hypothetical protein QQF64_024696 [Cirrhinus molitorella]|uniref:Uncharacterized protein n=1 Tax=Cirrhinus molitorella TaxID=172907 RepID=A0ABR3NM10_9TELE